MDDAGLVGLVESLDYVENLGGRLGGWQRAPAVHQVLERVAAHQLHDDVRLAGLFIGAKDKDAARMIDPAREPALLPEALQSCARVGKARRDQLQRDASTA